MEAFPEANTPSGYFVGLNTDRRIIHPALDLKLESAPNLVRTGQALRIGLGEQQEIAQA
jgi:hypothetical protein